MENEYSKTERIEDAQLESALAFRSWKEKHDKKKEAMLEAFREIHGQYGVDAETAFMAFGLADADEAFAKAIAERAIKDLSAAVVWEAFNILNELRKEGKIKEDE